MLITESALRRWRHYSPKRFEDKLENADNDFRSAKY